MPAGLWEWSKSLVPLFPCHDVVVPANLVDGSPIQYLPYLFTPGDGLRRGTIGVKDHAVILEKNVVTDQEYVFENVEAEARGMAIDVEGLDAILFEILIEGNIEGETAAQIMGGVQFVNPDLAGKKISILVGGTEKMVMGEHEDVRRFQAFVKG